MTVGLYGWSQHRKQRVWRCKRSRGEEDRRKLRYRRHAEAEAGIGDRAGRLPRL